MKSIADFTTSSESVVWSVYLQFKLNMAFMMGATWSAHLSACWRCLSQNHWGSLGVYRSASTIHILGKDATLTNWHLHLLQIANRFTSRYDLLWRHIWPRFLTQHSDIVSYVIYRYSAHNPHDWCSYVQAELIPYHRKKCGLNSIIFVMPLSLKLMVSMKLYSCIYMSGRGTLAGVLQHACVYIYIKF